MAFRYSFQVSPESRLSRQLPRTSIHKRKGTRRERSADALTHRRRKPSSSRVREQEASPDEATAGHCAFEGCVHVEVLITNRR
ncbi:hypothetical protein BD414DRAFT_73385 [Trametes punicea]|nr:hypothetical protein BD414DRAFT_73385 [Trametes punicea]